MKKPEFYISTDKSKFNIEEVESLMKQTYWAKERTLETITKSIENSICYGVYKYEQLVGFGRVVTDYSTVFWVCDVIIDKSYRGNSLGKKIMEEIMQTKELEGLLGILVTKDAHGLYEKYGFVKEGNKFMVNKRLN